ncbi:unnamed protein product, partial [Notodromas monacha]
STADKLWGTAISGTSLAKLLARLNIDCRQLSDVEGSEPAGGSGFKRPTAVLDKLVDIILDPKPSSIDSEDIKPIIKSGNKPEHWIPDASKWQKMERKAARLASLIPVPNNEELEIEDVSI